MKKGFLFVIWVGILSACTSKMPAQIPQDPLQKGHLLYQARCTSCHNANPKIAGSLGPALQGTSLEVLKAKTKEGAYPLDYTPKRKTHLMPKQSLSDEEIQALFGYLNTRPWVQ